MGGAQAQLPTLAIAEVEHDPFTGRVAAPAAAALPEVGWLELGQQGL